jgi:RHS repeat-associated protein
VPDYFVKNDTTYRIIADHLGSVRLVVRVIDGIVVQKITYDGFGQVTEDTNPGWQPFGYIGGIYDGDTRLVKLGSRDYAPHEGRWMSRDFVWHARISNSYLYAMNTPVTRIDIDGRSDWMYYEYERRRERDVYGKSASERDRLGEEGRKMARQGVDPREANDWVHQQFGYWFREEFGALEAMTTGCVANYVREAILQRRSRDWKRDMENTHRGLMGRKPPRPGIDEDTPYEYRPVP